VGASGGFWRVEEVFEFFGDGVARAVGFAGVVVHGAVVVAEDLGGEGDVVEGHLAEGPLPDVVFFEAAEVVATEADGVVADFVEEDGGGDGGAGFGAGDEAFDFAGGVGEFVGGAGHGGAPFSDGDFVLGFLVGDELGVVGAGSGGGLFLEQVCAGSGVRDSGFGHLSGDAAEVEEGAFAEFAGFGGDGVIVVGHFFIHHGDTGDVT